MQKIDFVGGDMKFSIRRLKNLNTEIRLHLLRDDK